MMTSMTVMSRDTITHARARGRIRTDATTPTPHPHTRARARTHARAHARTHARSERFAVPEALFDPRGVVGLRQVPARRAT